MALLQGRFYNFNANHFDTGVELHDTFRIFVNDYNNFFQGHFKIIKILLAKIFYFENIYLVSLIFFIIQTFCILSPLFFISDFKIRLMYIANPITWNFLLGDFHYDFFLIPFYFILNNLKNKNKNYYLLSFFFGFIKEHFFIFPIIIGIFYYFKEKNFNGLFYQF